MIPVIRAGMALANLLGLSWYNEAACWSIPEAPKAYYCTLPASNGDTYFIWTDDGMKVEIGRWDLTERPVLFHKQTDRM